MDWELFVDESGTFDSDEHCVIGGLLCPEGTITAGTLISWKNDILKKEEYAELARRGWVFDHCEENGKILRAADRWRAQAAVLKIYQDKITPLGGRFVLFTCPGRYFNTDNTTNFLTVFAKGLMMLFERLNQESAVTSLRIHAAQRVDVTYRDSMDLHEVSPTAGGPVDHYILGDRYRNQFRHLAFLYGGHRLLGNPVFVKMVETLEIVPDIFVSAEGKGDYTKDAKGRYRKLASPLLGTGGYARKSNPLTVPCDYVCNSYQQKAVNPRCPVIDEFNRIFDPGRCLILPTDQPFIPVVLFNAGDTVSGDALISLFSADFPEIDTARFIGAMNGLPPELQRTAVRTAVELLRPVVRDQVNIPLMLSRLQSGIQFAEKLRSGEIRDLLTADLLLYKRALYNHQGNREEIAKTDRQFEEIIDRISDAEEAGRLLNVADNQTIVSLTDEFRYEDATCRFWEAEDYWKSRINAARIRSPKYPVWGRTVGSYIQLLTHMLHAETDQTGREKIIAEAEKYIDVPRLHFTDETDISRYHQNCCDYRSEKKEWTRAFRHLHASVLGEDEARSVEISTDAAKLILSGVIAESRIVLPYPLLHFTRMLSLMFLDDADSGPGELMTASLMDVMDRQLLQTVGHVHPRTQIAWRYASATASRKTGTAEEKALSNALFSECADELFHQSEPVFIAIAVGISAEYLWHLRKKHIPGNVAYAGNLLQNSYAKFLRVKPEAMLDPFRAFFSSEAEIPGDETLFRASLAIGY